MHDVKAGEADAARGHSESLEKDDTSGTTCSRHIAYHACGPATWRAPLAYSRRPARSRQATTPPKFPAVLLDGILRARVQHVADCSVASSIQAFPCGAFLISGFGSWTGGVGVSSPGLVPYIGTRTPRGTRKTETATSGDDSKTEIANAIEVTSRARRIAPSHNSAGRILDSHSGVNLIFLTPYSARRSAR